MNAVPMNRGCWTHLGGRRRRPFLAVVALCIGMALTGQFFCTPPPSQHFYPDDYFTTDRIYRNKPLGFAMQFEGQWELALTTQEMRSTARKAAKVMHNSGRELLF